MAKWFPTEEQTFVFRHPGTGRAIVMLIPDGEEPKDILIDECRYLLDAEKTEQTRMYVRVAERKRLNISD